MDSSSCLFCKLSNVTENIVYESKDLFVIVDRFPFSNRHLLIIPKTHRSVLHECEDGIIQEMILVAKKLAVKLNMQKYNILQNNVNQQLIPHVHLHLIECNNSGGLNLKDHQTLKLTDDEYVSIVKDVKKMLSQ